MVEDCRSESTAKDLFRSIGACTDFAYNSHSLGLVCRGKILAWSGSIPDGSSSKNAESAATIREFS